MPMRVIQIQPRRKQRQPDVRTNHDDFGFVAGSFPEFQREGHEVHAEVDRVGHSGEKQDKPPLSMAL
jgi:hypothetical protein